MFFNSLPLSAKPFFSPLETSKRKDALLFFPKPAAPSQKLLSSEVSTISCAKLPSNVKTQRHFVLVHGARCWYKVSAQLESAGHNVTAWDMAASVVHPNQVHELDSFEDYFDPLMEFMGTLPPEERMVLVGHSMGGKCISVATERFPEKISAAAFDAVVMPGPHLSLKAIAEKHAAFSMPIKPKAKSEKRNEKMGEANNQKKHFVLIHGSVSGAWIWYKVKPMLEAAGHRVTALDMAASGVCTKTVEEVRTFDKYNEPLMDFMAKLPGNEKVVLVGHSLGGLNLAFAMEKFPEKISLAVFVTAILPDTVHQPSYMLEKYNEIGPKEEEWQDTVFSSYGTPDEPNTCFYMGYEFMKCKPLHLCSSEDLSLQMLLSRPGSMFVESLSKAKKFTDERYGSVPRAYIVCTEDLMMSASFQRCMIEQNEVKAVMEIPADHMPVFSKPKELSQCILELARKHA